MIGSQVGHFRLSEELGRGDFGVTYRGVHHALPGQDLALKVAHAHLDADGLFLELLQRECAPLDRLQHPAVASFLGLVTGSGRLTATRELVAGDDLATILARGTLSIRDLQTWLEGVLQALAHAHQHGVVHGDLTPTNMFWRYDGTAALTDFGVARTVHALQATRSGRIRGNLDYLAPERMNGELGPAADLYALGLVVFEALVGHPACPPGDEGAKLGWHCYQGIVDPRRERPDCPPWLASVVCRLAATDPSARPPTGSAALELFHALFVSGGEATAAVPNGGNDTLAYVDLQGRGLEPTQLHGPPSGMRPPPASGPVPSPQPPPSPGARQPAVLDERTTAHGISPVGFGAPPTEPPRAQAPVSSAPIQGFPAQGGFGAPTGHGRAPAPSAPPAVSAPAPPPTAAVATTEAPPAQGIPAHHRGRPRLPGEVLDPIKERLKLAAFWAAALCILMVSIVAFWGFRTMEAKKLAAARATGPEIDHELLVGGGFDRTAEHESEQDASRGGAGGRRVGAAQGSSNSASPDEVREPGSVRSGDAQEERYLVGGEGEASDRGTLVLTSNPIGAKVWVDNDEAGYTPIDGHVLRRGRHVVRIELEGYHWVSREVEVRGGDAIDLGAIPLVPVASKIGPVELWSYELDGASVFVDGTHLGHLPVEVELSAGRHSFFIQPEGGEPVELDLEVDPGTESRPGRLQLEPR